MCVCERERPNSPDFKELVLLCSRLSKSDLEISITRRRNEGEANLRGGDWKALRKFPRVERSNNNISLHS